MGLFDKFRRRKDAPTGAAASARTLGELREFMASREGVEAFIEPPTPVYAMTLCLVAGDGEHMRRAIKDERQARSLCTDLGVPLYDARIVGYPKRMKEYERGFRQARVSLDDLPPLRTTDRDPDDRERG